MTQIFKSLNSRTIPQYLSCYFDNIIAMPMRHFSFTTTACVSQVRYPNGDLLTN